MALGSYAVTQPTYYQVFQPDAPWEAGGPGWYTAPYVGWGRNPNRSLPPQLAIQGLGCGCGVGQATDVFSSEYKPPIWPIFALLGIAGLSIWAVAALAKE